MPSEKICERLKGMDQQICEVKYEVRSSTKNKKNEQTRAGNCADILKSSGAERLFCHFGCRAAVSGSACFSSCSSLYCFSHSLCWLSFLLVCPAEQKPKEAVDWSTVNFDKMRVKELKQTLTSWGEKCDGCTEKGDFLRLIKTVLPKQIALQQAAKGAGKGADKKDL